MTTPLTDEQLEAALQSALAERRLTLGDTDTSGRAVLSIEDWQVHVSRQTLVHEAREGGDLRTIGKVLDALLAHRGGPPDWFVARSGLRISLESNTRDLGTSLTAPLTPRVTQVLCWTDPNEALITWVNGEHVDRWGVTEAELQDLALDNLDAMIEPTPLLIETFQGRPLAMLDTDSVFKAALLLAPSLRAKVEPQLGWPVRAVAPARDFLFLFRDGDDELLGALGNVVLHEHANTRYPVSAEVFRVDDEGLRAIGEFRAQGSSGGAPSSTPSPIFRIQPKTSSASS